jgi:hypothetical protein
MAVYNSSSGGRTPDSRYGNRKKTNSKFGPALFQWAADTATKAMAPVVSDFKAALAAQNDLTQQTGRTEINPEQFIADFVAKSNMDDMINQAYDARLRGVDRAAEAITQTKANSAADFQREQAANDARAAEILKQNQQAQQLAQQAAGEIAAAGQSQFADAQAQGVGQANPSVRAAQLQQAAANNQITDAQNQATQRQFTEAQNQATQRGSEISSAALQTHRGDIDAERGMALVQARREAQAQAQQAWMQAEQLSLAKAQFDAQYGPHDVMPGDIDGDGKLSTKEIDIMQKQGTAEGQGQRFGFAWGELLSGLRAGEDPTKLAPEVGANYGLSETEMSMLQTLASGYSQGQSGSQLFSRFRSTAGGEEYGPTYLSGFDAYMKEHPQSKLKKGTPKKKGGGYWTGGQDRPEANDFSDFFEKDRWGRAAGRVFLNRTY